MNKVRFEQNLEQVINNAIMSCYPARWSENTITEELLRAIGKHLNTNSYFDSSSGLTKIIFSLYKLSGKPETEHGDIAMLTTIRFDNGKTLKGVASFEAKKRLMNDFKYRAQSRKGQYTKIVQHTPYAQILLYDYEPITQHIKPIFNSEYWNGYQESMHLPFLFTNCVTAPLYIFANESSVTRNDVRHTRLLTEQLCRRIFYGVDLHYDTKIIKDILNFDSKSHPMFVVTLEVTHGNTSITNDNDRFQIDDNIYTLVQ